MPAVDRATRRLARRLHAIGSKAAAEYEGAESRDWTGLVPSVKAGFCAVAAHVLQHYTRKGQP